jgi:hypothetical protein
LAAARGGLWRNKATVCFKSCNSRGSPQANRQVVYGKDLYPGVVHDGDNRDWTSGRVLDELDQLLTLTLDKRLVRDSAAEPQDQLVKEENERVGATVMGVARELCEAGVEVDIACCCAPHSIAEAR